MKLRKQEYGEVNLIGRRVEQLRKAKKIKQKDFIAQLQVAGLDINPKLLKIGRSASHCYG